MDFRSTTVTADDIRPITDITLFDSRAGGRNNAQRESFFVHDQDGKIFFGEAKAELLDWATDLIKQVSEEYNTTKQHSFSISNNGFHFRVQRTQHIDGPLYKLRRQPDAVPDLDIIPLPPFWKDILTSDRISMNGGAVIFAGDKSHGKTTLMTATMVANVKKRAGYAVLVEAPHEYRVPMHLPADTRQGTFLQIDATEIGFEAAINQSFRAYDRNDNKYFGIGEVRDHTTAAAAIQTTNAGEPVYFTVHSTSIDNLLSRIILALQSGTAAYNDQSAREALASAIRVVVFQRLYPGKKPITQDEPFPHPIEGELLYSEGPGSALARAIRNNDSEGLEQEVQRQRDAFQQATGPDGERQTSLSELLDRLRTERG